MLFQVTPGDVTTTAGVRKAMGVELHPAASASLALPEESADTTVPEPVADPISQTPAPDDVDKDLLDLLEASGSRSW